MLGFGSESVCPLATIPIRGNGSVAVAVLFYNRGLEWLMEKVGRKMEAKEALVIVTAYGEHQQARKRMKSMFEAATRGQVSDEEVVAVVAEYMRTGLNLDAAIDTKGLLPLG